jgi:hypothetical protein
MEIGQQQQPLARVVEGDDGVEQKKESLRHRAFPRMPIRNLFEEPHGIVGQVSHRAGCQRRELRVRVEAGLDRQALERMERFSRDWLFLAAPLLEDPIGLHREARDRTASEKRVAGDGLASRDALEKKALLPRRSQPPHDHDGRERVGGKDARHRNGASVSRSRAKVSSLLLAARQDFSLRLAASAPLTASVETPRAVMAAAR